MNFTTLSGFSIGLFLIYYATSHGVSHSEIFINEHAIVLVFGGTLATVLLCFPFRQILGMIWVFFETLIGRSQEKNIETVNEIVNISKSTYDGKRISEILPGIKNEFLRESLELLDQGTLSAEELEAVLEKRIDQQDEHYRKMGSTFKVLGKFPPAFGLIGATVGMIALLQGLGKPDAFKNLGPAMATALVATFYGLIVANIFIIPIGENIMSASEDNLTMRRIVIDGVMLIQAKKHPILVEEFLLSYLTPGIRNKARKSEEIKKAA